MAGSEHEHGAYTLDTLPSGRGIRPMAQRAAAGSIQQGNHIREKEPTMTDYINEAEAMKHIRATASRHGYFEGLLH